MNQDGELQIEGFEEPAGVEVLQKIPMFSKLGFEDTVKLAGIARMVGDVGLAEDLAHDALVSALERWPESGVPDNPGAWLMATAKNRAIALRYKVESIPNVFVFVGEKCVAQFFGRTKLAEVREAVERALAQVPAPVKEVKLKTWQIPRPARAPQVNPSFA